MFKLDVFDSLRSNEICY